MLAPPNYGSDYAARFNAIYPELSKSFGVPLYPFFLEGVAAEAKLNQPDGLHPTAEGVDVIVKNILPMVEAFLGTIVRATQLKNRQYPGGYSSVNATCFAESHKSGRN